MDHRELNRFGRIACLSTRALAFSERGDLTQSRDNIERAWRILDDDHNALNLATAADLHAVALILAGYLDDAAAIGDQAVRRSADMSPIAQRLCRATKGAAALAKGDLRTALQLLQPGSMRHDTDVVTERLLHHIRINYAIAAARSARVADSESALDGIGGEYADLLRARAWITAAEGRPHDAQRLARRAAETACANGQLGREVMCWQDAVQFGATDAAARLAELATSVQGPRAILTTRYARALNDHNGDELDSVSESFETMGDALAAADAAGHAFTAHQRAGRPQRALMAAARARRLVDRCGGGASPALTDAMAAKPFTDRQRDIARLIVVGRTNREIAAALSLSVRTVEGHIYRASCEAGVSSRADLAKVVVALDHTLSK